ACLRALRAAFLACFVCTASLFARFWLRRRLRRFLLVFLIFPAPCLVAEIAPGMQAVAVFLEPPVADVLAIVHVRDHHVLDAIVGHALRLLHRRAGAADDQHDAGG